MDTMSGSQQSFDVFDVRKIRKLISLMQENDLTEIDLKHADSAVRIKRGGEVASYSAPALLHQLLQPLPLSLLLRQNRLKRHA